MDDLRLDGRVVVVTGGAAGIGAATARRCAALGAHVAICDRDADGLASVAADVSGLGGECVTGELDVRDATACRSFFEALRRVDVLVNNAGGGFWAPVTDVSANGVAALVAENFTQVLETSRLAKARMPDGGSIVNVTSSEASRGAPGFAVYAAMKAGVENLTKTLALEWAADGVRVNAVAPDRVPTPGEAGLSSDAAATDGVEWAPTPLPWAATAGDCAAVIAFLVSDAARFVTGVVVPVDGGNAAAAGWKRTPGGWRV